MSSSSKYLFGLDREPISYFDCAVESLKQMFAEQATKLARWPPFGNQFNPAVASPALGTGDIGLSHDCKFTTPRRKLQLSYNYPPVDTDSTSAQLTGHSSS